MRASQQVAVAKHLPAKRNAGWTIGYRACIRVEDTLLGGTSFTRGLYFCVQAKLTVNEDAAGTATAATIGAGAAATWALLGGRSRTQRGLAMILPPVGKQCRWGLL